MGTWEGESKKGREAISAEACRRIMLQRRSISLAEETSIAVANEHYLPQGTVQTVAREEAR